MPSGDAVRSAEETRRLARWAGAVYLSLGLATLAGFFHAPLVHDGVDVITRAVATPGVRFRAGVLSDVLSTVLGVVLALLLYELLKPVHRTRAALMALLLLVAIPMSFAGTLNYVAAHLLLGGAMDTVAFTGAQRDALAMLFLRLHVHGVLAEEIFWGLWLVPFGLLVMRSGFLPRVLGILLIVAGIAYVAHSVTSLLLGGQRFVIYERVTMLARAAGEFPVILWLLLQGARVPHPDRPLAA